MDLFSYFMELAKTEFTCPCCQKKTVFAKTIMSTITKELYCFDCFMELHKQGRA